MELQEVFLSNTLFHLPRENNPLDKYKFSINSPNQKKYFLK